MTAKKAPARCCEGRGLKVEIKNTPALNSAPAFQAQTLDFQAGHLARRFGLPASIAATVASLAWTARR